MSVIKSFTPGEPELSVADIASKAGIPKPTAYRMLATLSYGGLLEQNPNTGQYKIGPALYMLGSLYLDTTDILKAAKPVMEALNGLTSEAINVSIFDKGYVILVMREEARYPFRWAHHIGTARPAYATAQGKALLSGLTEAELDSLYPEENLPPLTSKTIATKTELKLQLAEIRETGVAFNREEAYDGIEGLGTVIRNASGRAAATLGIGLPVFRMNQGYRERLATLVRLGSNLISYRLGYQDTVNPVHDIQEIRSWWEQNQPDSASQANSLTQAASISRNVTVEGERV